MRRLTWNERYLLRQVPATVAIVVSLYLLIWYQIRHDEDTPPDPSVQQRVQDCDDRGGVYIHSVEGFTCVRLERL